MHVLLQVVFCIVLFCALLINRTYEIPTYVSVGLPADPPQIGNSNALKGAAKVASKKKNALQVAEIEVTEEIANKVTKETNASAGPEETKEVTKEIEENKVTEEKDSPQEPPPFSGQVVFSEDEGPVSMKILHCKPGSPGDIFIKNRIKNEKLAEKKMNKQQLAEKKKRAAASREN